MNINKKKIEKWFPGLIAVLFFITIPVFVFDSDNERATIWIYSYYAQLFFMIVTFFVNYLVIVPKYYFSKSKVKFFLYTFLIAIVILVLNQFFNNEILDTLKESHAPDMIRPNSQGFFSFHPKLLDNLFLLLLTIGFSTGMGILHQHRKNSEEQKEIDKARVESELAFLKNQINPHFFFNSLNNIYALIAIDGDKAQVAVEKLSGLMRYLIYDSDIKTVDLNKEFEFCQNYIALMQQRLSPKVKLNITIQDDVPKAQIPPLIFITFIENAFKHGISYREDSYIKISLTVENNKVIFISNNSVPTSPADENIQKGGFGIVNVKKRLNLIFGDEADLQMIEQNKVYSVRLSIPIKPNV